jgi:antibiotic biosynthesis monooxygenase (ABM) superfamily enzyme
MMSLTRRDVIQHAALFGTAGVLVENRLIADDDRKRPVTTRPILLQIYFQVAPERSDEFEKMFAESYVPAMRKQQGYLRSGLLRLFAPGVAEKIEAAPTEFNYQMELVFDTEENRQKWVASKEHATAWPHASGMAEKFAWRGFDVVGTDQHRPQP